MLDRSWARHLGLRELGDSNHGWVDTLRLAGLTLRHFWVALDDFRRINEAAGRFQAGIIGAQFLQHFTVEVDYRERLVRLYDPARYAYTGSGVVIPFASGFSYPVIRAPIALPDGDSAKSRLLLDTGNGSLCVILYTPFVNRHGFSTALATTIDGPLITGLAGPLHVAVGRLSGFRVGGLALDSIPTGFGREEKSFLSIKGYDGVLGGRLFRGGRVILDYSRHRVILEPEALAGRDCSYDHSGLTLRAQSPDYRRFNVAFVAPGSPAAERGIQIGDELLAIDGRPSADFELPDIRKLFAADGVLRQVRVGRGADTILVALLLRRLF